MKGHSSSGGNGNNYARGRQYLVMLLLAFGAAVLGVMVLHKLRERRIFSLLVKEKDHQLISLHLLLQKEREQTKEAKRKIGEMKAKMYSIRTQKTELDSKISEMHSIISSLKEEQKTLESALEEKQNEIKFLKEKDTADPNKEDPQLITLKETLKQKEAEIEELKHRLESPIKVWSLTTNDPSNSPKTEAIVDESGTDGGANVSNIFQENVRDRIGIEKSTDEGFHNIDVKKENPNTTEALSVSEAKEENKVQAVAGNGKSENLNIHGNDEKQENPSGSDAMENERAYETKSTGKRWIVRAKKQIGGGDVNAGNSDVSIRSRRLRNGGQQSRDIRIRNMRFLKDGQQSGRYNSVRDGELQRLGKKLGDYEPSMNLNMKDELNQVNQTTKDRENVGDVQERTETSDGETADRGNREVNAGEFSKGAKLADKDEGAEDEETHDTEAETDHREYRDGQEEDREASNENTNEPEF